MIEAPNEGARLTGHSGNDEIGTPPSLYRWLDRRFAFNYDAAASHENHKAPYYSTSVGTFWSNPYDNPAVSPSELISWRGELIGSRDGLSYPWMDMRTFVNPPYSQPLMRQFIEKAIEERNSAAIVVMLVKYDASTANGRLLRDYFHLEYLSRVKYEGMSQGATFPSVIAIVRPDAWTNGGSR